MRYIRWIWIGFLLILLGCAVQPPPAMEKDGKTYGWSPAAKKNFRGTWYDYYRCALSYADGGFYRQSLWALDRSLERRQRAQQMDRRRARTYGMHFLDYFPHREQGIAHFYLGRYEQAKALLQRSIGEYPSEKAYFYLDQVRTRLLKAKPPSVPRLEVSFAGARADKAGRLWTAADPVQADIRAVDPQYIARILLRDQPVFMERSARRFSSREKLELAEGRHSIAVSAKNLREKTAQKRFILHVDRTAPVIALEGMEPGKPVRGHLYDLSGQIRLAANHQDIPLPAGQAVDFSLGAGFVGELIATDRVGNQSRMRIPSAPLAAKGPLLASSGGLSDGSGPVWASRLGPRIKTPGWSQQETVFKEKIRLPIRVHSPHPLKSVWVNDRPVPGRMGRHLSFDPLLSLSPGPNPVRITAEDKRGEKQQKILLITRQIPLALQLNQRYGFVVHPLAASDSYENSQPIHQAFLADLLEKKRFQFHVRPTLRTRLPASARPYCKTPFPFEPRAILMGSLHQRQKGLEIAIRLVETQSSRIVALADVYGESLDKADIMRLSARLSQKLHRRLPLMQGEITDIQGQRIRLSPESWVPQKGRLRPGWPILLYQHHPRGGRGSESRIWGEARIEGPYQALLEGRDPPDTGELAVITR